MSKSTTCRSTYIWYLMGCFLLMGTTGFAQRTSISNVRFEVNHDTLLVVQYDLTATQPGDSVYFRVKSRLKGNSVRPQKEFVTGDIGRNVPAGKNRRFVWNAVANGYEFDEEVQIVVLVRNIPPAKPARTEPVAAARPSAKADPEPRVKKEKRPAQPKEPAVTKQKIEKAKPAPKPEKPVVSVTPVDTVARKDTTQKHQWMRAKGYGGADWTLLSMVAPGLGNIFVQPKPKVGLRPLVTAGFYGLLIYGFSEQRKATTQYNLYKEQKNFTEGEPYYKEANTHHQRYYIATRVAGAIWATDVVLTLIRGIQNENGVRRKQKTISLHPGVQAGQPVAVVRVKL